MHISSHQKKTRKGLMVDGNDDGGCDGGICLDLY